jgi:hypothetical protein
MRAFLVLAVIGGLVFPVAAAPADTVVLKARLSAKYLRTTSKGSRHSDDHSHGREGVLEVHLSGAGQAGRLGDPHRSATRTWNA